MGGLYLAGRFPVVGRRSGEGRWMLRSEAEHLADPDAYHLEPDQPRPILVAWPGGRSSRRALMAGETVRRWFQGVAEDFNEALPPVDPRSVAASAWMDRFRAHAAATGRLETVTYPRGSRVVVHSPDGRRREAMPGEPMVVVDGSGPCPRGYLLRVADDG